MFEKTIKLHNSTTNTLESQQILLCELLCRKALLGCIQTQSVPVCGPVITVFTSSMNRQTNRIHSLAFVSITSNLYSEPNQVK